MNTTTTKTTKTNQLPPGSRAPLIFTFRDIVAGQGFLARVQVRGKLVARFEEDGVWFEGVVPDNLSAGGFTFNEARAEFRRDFTAVLYDLANENGRSIEELRTAITQMLSQTNDHSDAEWLAAVDEARAQRHDQHMTIETMDPQTATFVEVEPHQDEKATPVRDNVLEPEPALASAA